MTIPTMETTMAGVFAAGDVRSGSTKQLGSAVGEGIAALLMTAPLPRIQKPQGCGSRRRLRVPQVLAPGAPQRRERRL